MIRIVFFILMAFGLTGFGTVAWIATRQARTEAAVPAAPTKITVLAAARAISAGSLLKHGDFAPQIVAVDAEHVGEYTPDSPDLRRDLVGAMTRRALAPGDAVRESDVIRPGEHGFLAAALRPGMRAVTITVDTGTGAGELIGPGDRVDVILTQALNDPSVPASRRVAAETVLSDARVLAIDQKLVLGADTPSPERGGNRTVTLEVTDGQAQRVSVAVQLGHLSISVRSAENAQQTAARQDGTMVPHPEPKTVWAVDVSPALGVTNTAPAPTGNMIRVYQGSGDVKEFKF